VTRAAVERRRTMRGHEAPVVPPAKAAQDGEMETVSPPGAGARPGHGTGGPG
jgi:hypothetical protein